MQWLQRLVGLAILGDGVPGCGHPVARRGRRRTGAGRAPRRRACSSASGSVFYDTVMPSPRVHPGSRSGSRTPARGGRGRASSDAWSPRARRSEDPRPDAARPQAGDGGHPGRRTPGPSRSPSSSRPTTRSAASPRRSRRCCRSPCRRRASWWWPTTAPTRTVRLAREAGVDVFETVDNRHKKAGGLNQALDAVPPGPGRQRLRDGDGRRHQARRRVPRGGGAPADRRPCADGRRRALLRRGGRRPDRSVPAQRVHPLPARPAAAPGPRLRADRYGVGVPAAGAACGGRRARHAPSRACPGTSTTRSRSPRTTSSPSP